MKRVCICCECGDFKPFGSTWKVPNVRYKKEIDDWINCKVKNKYFEKGICEKCR